MKEIRVRLLSLLALLLPMSITPVAAADADPFADAKAIIADIERIVTPNGVEEMFTAKIGSIDQWLQVRGRDRDNPLLLYLHGGPAAPVMPWAWTFQRPWEEFFTVVQWDQRGAGKTYLANDPEQVAPTIHIEQFVADTLEVIELLRKRYNKDKVIVLGHSWGTIIGLEAARRRPEWVHAYVGIGQVISVRENERVGYEYALRMAKLHDNQEAIRELEALAPYPGEEFTPERVGQQRKWAQYYWGLSAYRHDSEQYFKSFRLSPVYSPADRAALNAGSELTLGRILDEWAAVDFRKVRQMQVPVIMFMGRHDYTTPSQPTADWLAALEAPVKHGIWFEHSAHLAPLEEPGKVLIELVNRVLPLAQE